MKTNTTAKLFERAIIMLENIERSGRHCCCCGVINASATDTLSRYIAMDSFRSAFKPAGCTDGDFWWEDSPWEYDARVIALALMVEVCKDESL